MVHHHVHELIQTLTPEVHEYGVGGQILLVIFGPHVKLINQSKTPFLPPFLKSDVASSYWLPKTPSAWFANTYQVKDDPKFAIDGFTVLSITLFVKIPPALKDQKSK